MVAVRLTIESLGWFSQVTKWSWKMTKKSKVMIIDFTIKDNKEKSQSKYTLS